MKTIRSSEPKLLQPCETPAELHEWVKHYCGLDIPTRAVCPHHHPPFEYLSRAYFEPAKDLVVWAPRGGGKTRLGAVATLLDLLHKPGVAVRILGGSFDQSLRMWEHLIPDLEESAKEMIDGQVRASRKVRLCNGSSAAVLTQSQRAVRGLRVQKLRCDEVELFKPDVWEAAQLVTKSLKIKAEKSRKNQRKSAIVGEEEDLRDEDMTPSVAGVIEAISTLHTPFGLMQRIVESAEVSGIRVVKWCLLDVLEKCPPERECKACPLWEDCGGVAKEKCSGFVSIEDAIAMKRRVSREVWDAEMLCKRPSVRGCVFPHFEPDVHIISSDPKVNDVRQEMTMAIDFGFAGPFVCLWVAEIGGVSHVVDEYVESGRMMFENIEQLRARRWKAVRVSCDPAGVAKNDQTATSDVSLLKRAGFEVRQKRSRIQDGLEKIRAALRPATGRPTLFVHARCEKLIRALRCYRYPDGGGEVPDKDGVHDHPIDALRYYFVNRKSSEISPPWRY